MDFWATRYPSRSLRPCLSSQSSESPSSSLPPVFVAVREITVAKHSIRNPPLLSELFFCISSSLSDAGERCTLVRRPCGSLLVYFLFFFFSSSHFTLHLPHLYFTSQPVAGMAPSIPLPGRSSLKMPCRTTCHVHRYCVGCQRRSRDSLLAHPRDRSFSSFEQHFPYAGSRGCSTMYSVTSIGRFSLREETSR